MIKKQILNYNSDFFFSLFFLKMQVFGILNSKD